MLRETKERLVVTAAMVATILLSLRMFFGIGFTTDDDFQYFLTARTPFSNWMTDARIYAHGAGRFYFLITKVFYYVPYLFDSFVWTKAVQYITLLACYAMFAYTAGRIFKSRRLGAITLLLLVWGTSVTPNLHIPTIAYPFYFTFSSILFMLGLLEYLRYTERGGYWRVIVSAVLMLVCFLFYETYLVFAILLGLAIMVRHRFKMSDKAMWAEATPLLAAAILYVGCYFGYRQYLLATIPDLVFYDGSTFDSAQFSLRGFYNVVRNCTRAGMPMYNYIGYSRGYFGEQNIIAENSMLVAGHRDNLFRMLTHASAAMWVNAVLQALLLWWFTGKEWYKRLRWRQIGTGIIVAAVAAFAANTLIAMATKYNVEWSGWIAGYVTSFYSFLFISLILALVIAASFKAFNNTGWKNGVRLIWCVLIMLSSVVIGYSNEHIAREWHKSASRVKIIDHVAHHGQFDALPSNAILYTEELHNTPGIAFGCSYRTNDIEHYLNLRAGRWLNMACDSADLATMRENNPDAPVYYLHAQCAPKGGDMLLAFALMDSTCTTATEADVFYLSPAKRYTVFYRCGETWQSKQVNASNNEKLTYCHIAAEAIEPRSIMTSIMTVE